MACNCFTGTAYTDEKGNCFCKDANGVIIGVSDLPKLGIDYMPRSPRNGGVHTWPSNLIGDPCAGKQAPSGYRYVYTNDAGCILIRLVDGSQVITQPATNAGSAVATATNSTVAAGAGLVNQISNFVSQNQTLVLLGAAFLAYETFVKKGR